MSQAVTTPAPSSAAAELKGVPVTVVILTYNEADNIADCIRSCSFTDDIHVLDSGSTDGTCEIAASLGAHVHQHPFTSFGEQRNWAIDNIPHKYEWVFHLDADERFTPELAEEVQRVIEADPQEAGFYVPHKLIFMGRWVRWAEGYPVYQMRFFHIRRMRFRDYGHGQREDTTGTIGWLKKPYLHYNFSKGLTEWLDKHNRYSSLEAEAIFAGRESGPVSLRPSLFGNVVQRRRYLTMRVRPIMPGKWLGRFIWSYFIKFGFLDGWAGLRYCLLLSMYELLISLKLEERRAQARQVPRSGKQEAPAEPVAERTEPTYVPVDGKDREAIKDVQSQQFVNTAHAASPAATAREGSSWSFMENVARVLWMFTQGTLFRFSFHNWYAWRRFLLRCFGARIGRGVRIRPSVRIEIPWHLEIGEGSIVGDFAILYCLGRITIGRHAVISQYAHLCAGTHDYTTRRFPLIRRPIRIGDEAWVAADAFIGPGVKIGDRAVVGARSTVIRDVAPDDIVAGSPAKFVKKRVLR